MTVLGLSRRCKRPGHIRSDRSECVVRIWGASRAGSPATPAGPAFQRARSAIRGRAERSAGERPLSVPSIGGCALTSFRLPLPAGGLQPLHVVSPHFLITDVVWVHLVVLQRLEHLFPIFGIVLVTGFGIVLPFPWSINGLFLIRLQIVHHPPDLMQGAFVVVATVELGHFVLEV